MASAFARSRLRRGDMQTLPLMPHVPTDGDPIRPDERHMVDFALNWAPFGGPSAEDVFVEFGMSLPRFQQRLAEIAKAQGRAAGR